MSCSGCSRFENPPDAFVELTVCKKIDCQRNGVRSMVALIKLGDRHTDSDIIKHRSKCRVCGLLDFEGKRAVCGKTRHALHWLTALGSFICPNWIDGSPDEASNKDRATLESTATPG